MQCDWNCAFIAVYALVVYAYTVVASCPIGRLGLAQTKGDWYKKGRAHDSASHMYIRAAPRSQSYTWWRPGYESAPTGTPSTSPSSSASPSSAERRQTRRKCLTDHKEVL
jgi:hypothetical protein